MARSFSEVAHELTQRSPKASFAAVLARVEVETQRAADPDGRAALLRRLLSGAKLQHLDIGARGGPKDEIVANADFFDVYLCEPDPKAARPLLEKGYHVISEAFWSRAGVELSLNVFDKPSNSSVLKPSTPMMEFWLGRLDKLDVTDIVLLRTTTIDDQERALCLNFDDIKIDAQGADFEIVQGFGGSRPFFVEVEMNVATLYEGQGLMHDIVGNLHSRGYMMVDIVFRRFNGFHPDANLPGKRRFSRGLGIRGDGWFMPDWTRTEGREIIERAPERWAATMISKGYEDILRWICARQFWPALRATKDVLDS
jgi:FkbM family methyltransferase